MSDTHFAEPAELERLSNPRPTLDGTKIAFTIECRSGDTADLACAVADVPSIIAFLVDVAIGASEQSGSVAPVPTVGRQVMVDPVPAQGIGFAPGRSSEEAFLLIHTAAFDLTFSVPSSGLARLAPALAQIGSTLSASGPKQ